MSVAPFRFRPVVVAIVVAAVWMVGDPSVIAASADGPPGPKPVDRHLGQEPDRLGMRRAYEPGKIPVVLIHGLWGFPHQWDGMVDELEADVLIRQRYQFWTFSYSSGDSIPFSAHRLRQSLRRARETFDPDGTDEAFDRMVVVGHSLGGIIAKMMAQASGSRVWQTVSNRPLDRLIGPPEDCQLLRKAYCYEPVREVRRLIFIATPHRGSPLVRGLIRTVGTQICDRASPFREAREAVLAQNDSDFFLPCLRREYPTSVAELALGHPLLSALCELGIVPSVPAHSIIADLRDPPAPGASDGIVPYSSSHVEGVASELLFHAHHICLDNPALNREVRRILLEHAVIGPVSTRITRPCSASPQNGSRKKGGLREVSQPRAVITHNM